MKRLPRIWATVALMAIAAVCAVSTVFAHARYKESTPAQGEVLAVSPASVSITFTQDVQKITGTYGIEVTGDGGAPSTAGATVLSDTDRSMMSVPLEPSLPAGRYVVRWKNVSDADGDPAEGAFSFYVGRQPTTAEAEQDRELEGVGAEEDTPSAASPTAGAEPTQVASPTPAPDSDDGDGGGNSVIFVIVIAGVIAVAVGAAILAWRARR